MNKIFQDDLHTIYECLDGVIDKLVMHPMTCDDYSHQVGK